jgi:hypothetical protein
MSIDSPLSLVILIEGGGEINYWKAQGRPDKANLVFFRTVSKDGEAIGYKNKRELGFLEKVQLLFGIGRFSTVAISRLVNSILRGNMTDVPQENKKLIDSSLQYVLEKSCVPKFVRKMVPIVFSEIDDLEKLLGSLQPQKPAAPQSLEGRVKIGAPEEKKTPPEVVPPSAPPSASIKLTIGRGIENPGSLCYCNSTIKAIWCSPALRAAIWKDEENETAKVLEAFKRVQEELRKDKPALAKDDIELISKHCPDLRYTLTHEPPTPKDVLERKQQVSEENKRTLSRQQVRRSLLKVLEELDQPGKESLSYKKEPLKSLREGLIGLFPRLDSDTEQQDQSQLFIPFLEAILSPDKRTPIVYKIEKQREQREINPQEQNVEHLEQQVYIPALDSKDTPPEAHSLYIHHPPTQGPEQDVQKIFSPFTVEENVEVDAFINLDKNRSLTEEQRNLLRSRADPQGRLPPVQVKQQLTFVANPPATVAEPPPFLPFYIARFDPNTRAKNQIKITAPFTLEVPVAGKEPARYQLRGIVMHSSDSTSLQSGHYHNFFPVPNSPKDEKGWPKMWVEHSDDRVYHHNWKDISEMISMNATLYQYDRID